MRLTIGCMQNHRLREIGILIFQPRQRVRREGRGYRGRIAASNSCAFDKAQVAEVSDVGLLHQLRAQTARAGLTPSAGRAIRIGRAAANDECCFAVSRGSQPLVTLRQIADGHNREHTHQPGKLGQTVAKSAHTVRAKWRQIHRKIPHLGCRLGLRDRLQVTEQPVLVRTGQ